MVTPESLSESQWNWASVKPWPSSAMAEMVLRTLIADGTKLLAYIGHT